MRDDFLGISSLFSLTVDDGRQIDCERIVFSRTYARLVVGRPTIEINRRIVQSAAERLKSAFEEAWPFYVIDPGPCAQLPLIEVCGSFSSLAFRLGDRRCTGLIVAWYEDRIQYPISEKNRMSLARLDWKQHAVDFDV